MKCLQVLAPAIFILGLMIGTCAEANDSVPVLTINIKNDKPDYFTTYTEEYYGGVSQTAPCSDLHLVNTVNGYWMSGSNSVLSMASKDMVNSWGQRLTCIRYDITYSGNVYSSGSIQTVWDENALSYVSATPNKINITLK